MSEAALVRDGSVVDAFGQDAFRVTVDGRWIGWVGDTRGGRWWACWREDGDSDARWNSDLTDGVTYGSRFAAVLALRSRAGVSL